MPKQPDEKDPRFRSLLQKAVRRGHLDLVLTIASMMDLLGTKARDWFRTRTAVITFEECWPLGTQLAFTRVFSSKAVALAQVALTEKMKDATGLAYLAHSLSEGDRSMLEGGENDRAIKIVANAIQRPQPFWQWVQSQTMSEWQQRYTANALRFKWAGKPHDQTVVKAAVYLALQGFLPEPKRLPANRDAFPYWVALDGHTPQGRRALKDIARDLYISLPQLEWVVFYYEGNRTSGFASSEWWDRFSRWYFHKIGIPAEEAHLLWEPVKPQLIEALEEDSRRFHHQLYAWKLDHQERVDTLKDQVIESLDSLGEPGRKNQLPLFDGRRE